MWWEFFTDMVMKLRTKHKIPAIVFLSLMALILGWAIIEHYRKPAYTTEIPKPQNIPSYTSKPLPNGYMKPKVPESVQPKEQISKESDLTESEKPEHVQGMRKVQSKFALAMKDDKYDSSVIVGIIERMEQFTKTGHTGRDYIYLAISEELGANVSEEEKQRVFDILMESIKPSKEETEKALKEFEASTPHPLSFRRSFPLVLKAIHLCVRYTRRTHLA